MYKIEDIVNKVHCADCLKFMKKMPDKSVDLVLTDPDYNAKDIGTNHRRYSQGKQLSVPNYKKFCKKWFNEANRIGKTVVFTPGIANTHNYPQPDWQICWHKPASVSFNRMGGFNVWEPIFKYSKVSERIGQDYILRNTLNFKKGPEKDHPCPKVLSLWLWIIIHFSKKGDIVCDPFLGSGTTAVACKELGRHFIGIDIVEKYCDIARQRLNQEILPVEISEKTSKSDCGTLF